MAQLCQGPPCTLPNSWLCLLRSLIICSCFASSSLSEPYSSLSFPRSSTPCEVSSSSEEASGEVENLSREMIGFIEATREVEGDMLRRLELRGGATLFEEE